MPDYELDLAAQLDNLKYHQRDLRAKEHFGEEEDGDVDAMISVNRRIRELQAAMGVELDPVYEPPPPEAPSPAPSASPDRYPRYELLDGLRSGFSEPVP